jgi:hypothetical protein
MAETPMPWSGVAEGRIVHVRHNASGRCQAAVVVRHWGGGTVNLQVFRDGSNDAGDGGDPHAATRHATSIQHESGVPAGLGWHWPERV